RLGARAEVAGGGRLLGAVGGWPRSEAVGAAPPLPAEASRSAGTGGTDHAETASQEVSTRVPGTHRSRSDITSSWEALWLANGVVLPVFQTRVGLPAPPQPGSGGPANPGLLCHHRLPVDPP